MSTLQCSSGTTRGVFHLPWAVSLPSCAAPLDYVLTQLQLQLKWFRKGDVFRLPFRHAPFYLTSALCQPECRHWWHRKGDVFHLLLTMALVLDDRWAAFSRYNVIE